MQCRKLLPSALRYLGLCSGRWWRELGAVLGRDPHDALDVRRTFHDRGSGQIRSLLADLLEEELVVAARRLAVQHPTWDRTHVREAVQIAFRNVDESTRTTSLRAAVVEELELALQHVEELVLSVMEVGRHPFSGLRYRLEERIRPAGLLAGHLAGYEPAKHPQ